jgi:hypothetical protein
MANPPHFYDPTYLVDYVMGSQPGRLVDIENAFSHGDLEGIFEFPP